MRKSYLILLLLITQLSFTNAQTKEQDKGHIKKMCGCYEVSFEYSETFSDVKDYKYRDRYQAKALEWILLDEETDDKLVLQHLLVISDSMIIKHWRQDWLYENEDILVYDQKLEWHKGKVPNNYLKGSWTQKVYQVDDSPRYEGHAHWVNTDGKVYWESQVSAPLPRREYTKRSDYNVMLRNNKHKITEYGHQHELDNAKVIRDGNQDSVLVMEKGYNTYVKVNDSKCKAAADWWVKNRRYWVDVRAVWAEIIAAKDLINIQSKVDNQRLWEHLFELGSTYAEAEKYKSKKAQKKIRKIIEPYLLDEPSPWKTTASNQSKP